MIKDQLQNNTYKINFTGGEPLIQYEAVKDLAKFIKEELGLRTYIESSCYDVNRFNKIISYIDICKIEFKTKDSQAVDIKHYRYLLNNEIECLKTAIENKKITFIKIVVSNSTAIKEFKELIEVIFNTIKSEELAGFIIQPTNNINEPTVDRLLQFYDLIYPRYNEVRVIPQLHKIIGAR
jgi:pyruvate-formate lyase-activating enzyme